MKCWGCNYEGKPEWGEFKTMYPWTVHVRCPKCKSTDKVVLTGLDGVEHEIRYPSFCTGPESRHSPIRKVIRLDSDGYAIYCPFCQWGMATGGSKLDEKELERLRGMYEKSLSGRGYE